MKLLYTSLLAISIILSSTSNAQRIEIQSSLLDSDSAPDIYNFGINELDGEAAQHWGYDFVLEG